jgi:hypothetical protein
LLKFGPLASNTNAAVALIPTAGPPPPGPGTQGCVVYSYAFNDTIYTNNLAQWPLGYRPFSFIDQGLCVTASIAPSAPNTT